MEYNNIGPNNNESQISNQNNFIMRKSSINRDGKFCFMDCKDILVSLDIGGTLAKLAFIVSKELLRQKPELDKELNDLNCLHKIEVCTGELLSKRIKNRSEEINLKNNGNNTKASVEEEEYENIKDSVLYLKNMSTYLMESEIIKKLLVIQSICNFQDIRLTGGGSVKFFDLIKNSLKVEVIKVDELQSLIHGYFIMNEYSTMYHLELKKLNKILSDAKTYTNQFDILNYEKINSIKTFIFPHLVVNIGSGVSIIKVFSENCIERVGGTMCGGGTLLGLGKLLLGTDNFMEIVELAKNGNHTNLDLLVSDIYGSNKIDSSVVSLEQDVLASSFGKVYQKLALNKDEKFSKEDLAQSLLLLICFQIAQLGFLYAEQNKIKHICYFGNFTQSGAFTIELLDFGTKFWSKEIQCHFNDLDGFLGSVGNLRK